MLEAVRRRARRGHATERGVLREPLTAAQRAEVARLLGTPWDVAGGPVRLQDLGSALAEHGLTVRGFVEALDGEELVDQRALRAEREAAATREVAAVVELMGTVGIEAELTRTWLTEAGLPRGGTGELLDLAERVARVLRRLPIQPPQRLAGLAAAEFANAHALDYREELGRALVRLIALVHDLPRPMRAGRDWRRAWAAAGVLCDGVSSRALALNLPLAGDAAAVRWFDVAPGEPVWVSLRSITGSWTAPTGTTVFVCENPTVLEAGADELGADCPPLVCTDGIPSIAALDLVSGLAAAGCEILARADVDESGFVVVEQVRSAAPAARLWRFDPATYARHFGLTEVSDRPDTGEVTLRHLRDLHARHGIALHEEAILDQLLADLGEFGRAGASARNASTDSTAGGGVRGGGCGDVDDPGLR
ncbi:uncharacterized protein (TIGR02679 family) [Amycolatopsis cihanbeyliensis]|uniref:Uncharacterized protein (TIGR02679 family) n=1 Tax=Amycolatopsis cihanbeyliensis TaxID=1128664 RepID=A0A542DGR3_AMYCI|nr:uncharacterized protein (TIGR02679 family) [Amycolatopsis cihanbeyliensis]